MTGTLDTAHFLQLDEISEKLFVSVSRRRGKNDYTGRHKVIFLLHGKINCKLHKFDVVESKEGNQNVLSPTTFKGETFKLKTTS